MICEKDVEAGVLKDRAKNHYTKHDWQHMR